MGRAGRHPFPTLRVRRPPGRVRSHAMPSAGKTWEPLGRHTVLAPAYRGDGSRPAHAGLGMTSPSLDDGQTTAALDVLPCAT